jgi:hypothetical protein
VATGARGSLDLLGGARIWHLSNEVNVSFLSGSASLDESFGWGDPVVGARALVRLNDRVSVLVYGDVGGFDVSGASRVTWQALATLNYAFNDRWSISGGYKALAVDYSSDDYVYDTVLSGPAIGASIRFGPRR